MIAAGPEGVGSAYRGLQRRLFLRRKDHTKGTHDQRMPPGAAPAEFAAFCPSESPLIRRLEGKSGQRDLFERSRPAIWCRVGFWFEPQLQSRWPKRSAQAWSASWGYKRSMRPGGRSSPRTRRVRSFSVCRREPSMPGWPTSCSRSLRSSRNSRNRSQTAANPVREPIENIDRELPLIAFDNVRLPKVPMLA